MHQAEMLNFYIHFSIKSNMCIKIKNTQSPDASKFLNVELKIKKMKIENRKLWASCGLWYLCANTLQGFEEIAVHTHAEW